MIADYPFYEETWHGDLLTGEEFPKYAERADAWLDEATLGRALDPALRDPVLTAVKKAECAVADALRGYDRAVESNPAVQKETVGDYSVTLRSASELSAELRDRISGIITRYLGRTGLMFRGVPIRCDHSAHRVCH